MGYTSYIMMWEQNPFLLFQSLISQHNLSFVSSISCRIIGDSTGGLEGAQDPVKK